MNADSCKVKCMSDRKRQRMTGTQVEGSNIQKVKCLQAEGEERQRVTGTWVEGRSTGKWEDKQANLKSKLWHRWQLFDICTNKKYIDRHSQQEDIINSDKVVVFHCRFSVVGWITYVAKRICKYVQIKVNLGMYIPTHQQTKKKLFNRGILENLLQALLVAVVK